MRTADSIYSLSPIYESLQGFSLCPYLGVLV